MEYISLNKKGSERATNNCMIVSQGSDIVPWKFMDLYINLF